MTDHTSCRYGAEHEAIQLHSDHPSHNDSVYFNFTGPPGGPLVGGVLRIGLRPGEGYGEASLVLPLAGGGVVFHYARTPPAGDEQAPGATTWRSGAMRLGAVDATRRWRLTYGGSQARLIADPRRFGERPGEAWRAATAVVVELDLDWRADFPVHALSPAGDLMPGGRTIAYGADHYEQFGHVGGTVRIGDEVVTLEGQPAFRDHSWGPRVWDAAPDQDFLCAHLDDGRRIVAVANRLQGAEDFHGVVWEPGAAGPLPIEAYTIHTSYAGGPAPTGPIGWTLRAGGATIELEGEIEGFLPLRVGHRGVRIAQTLLRLGPGTPGRAKTDLTRPAPPD